MIPVLAALLLAAASAPATGGTRPGDLCRAAARAAAARHGVPVELMLAITTVETGTTRDGARGPWPWTLNIAGRGAWFDSRAEALAEAERTLAGGETSFDLGCFQINYRWHGKNFGSLDAMLDPRQGADYAARFLVGLEAEGGDWIDAAGRYHSRTPVHAERYRAAVGRAIATLDPVAAERLAAGLAATDRAGTGAARTEAAGTGAAGPRAPGERPAAGPVPAGGVALTLLTRAAGGLLRAGRPGGRT